MDPSISGEFSLDFDKEGERYFDDYRYANIKYLSFPQFKEKTKKEKIILYQDFNLNKGGIFWDGSYLLIQYFLSFLHNENSKNWILELGSGTSLPAIVLKLLGYNVVATDLKYLIEFVKKNFSLNIEIEKTENLFINKLEWGKEDDIKAIKTICLEFDYIICSELIYIEESFDDLIKTLLEFSHENTCLIFSYRIRMKEKFQMFLVKLEKSFNVVFCDDEKLENIHPNNNLHIMLAFKKQN